MKKILLAAAAAVMVPGLALAANVSGDWIISFDAGGMPIKVKCHLAQQADALTGTCGAADASAPGADPAALTGSVSGSTAKWAYDVKFGDMPLHLVYTANLKSDTAMDGTIDAGQGTLPFTGVKQ